MCKKLVLAILIVGWCFHPTASLAAENDENTDCKKLTIDGRTGDVVGTTTFKINECVKVELKNKNPFLYLYKFSLEEKAVEESGLKDFLGLLGTPVSAAPLNEDELKKLEAAKNSQEGQPKISSTLPPGCEAPSTHKDRLTERNTNLTIAYFNLKDTLATSVVNLNNLRNTYDTEKNILKSATASSDDLEKAAQRMFPLPDGFKQATLKFAGLANSADSVKETADKQLLDIQLFRDSPYTAECIQGLEPAIKAFETVASVIAQDGAPYLLGAAQSAGSQSSEMLKNVIEVKNISELDRPYTESLNVSRKDSPRKVIVTVQRARRAEEKPEYKELAKVELTLGKPRFVLAAGMAFSPMEKREYQRIQQVSASDPTATVNIIGRKDSSSFRYSPMAILHAKICECGKYEFLSPYFSAGLTGKNDNKGTDVEYLFGLSLAGVKQQLFFTVGAYIGRQQSLDGNLYVNQVVPASLAEIPVRKSSSARLGFAISWKLK